MLGRHVFRSFSRDHPNEPRKRLLGPQREIDEGGYMKYSVCYEYRIGAEIFTAECVLESEHEPAVTDSEIIECALRDSARFVRSGLAGIVVTSITAAP